MSPRDPLPDLSAQEIVRYNRHLIMPEVALAGQRRLKAARVLLIGAGGLGSPAGLYLAAAGVGHLGLVDFDVVDASNLQRQILHTTRDIGRPKLESTAERLHALNPEIEVTTHAVRITAANALELIEPYDLVIDGTDNFPTRYLVNDACVLLGKPNVYGSIFRFEGQTSVFAPPTGPCYRCLYPEPPPPGLAPSCAEGGVLGVLPGVIGSLQATEAIKLLLGRGEPLLGRLLLYDALALTFHELRIHRDPQCPVCGDIPTITSLIDYDDFCGVHTSASYSHDDATVEEVLARSESGDDFVLLDVRSREEWQICQIHGAVLIPLPELPDRWHELDPTREVIVHCKTGQRSARAVALLREACFACVRNLRGGLDEWARVFNSGPLSY
jgi:sulfur-carrier protein adenylyltransferase/sulfurtransferase